MTGRTIPEGALYYGKTKRRVDVAFDDELRQLTERTIAQLRDILTSQKTPAAEYRANRCRACSLVDLCRPRISAKPLKQWRDKMLAGLLKNDSEA